MKNKSESEFSMHTCSNKSPSGLGKNVCAQYSSYEEETSNSNNMKAIVLSINKPIKFKYHKKFVSKRTRYSGSKN